MQYDLSSLNVENVYYYHMEKAKAKEKVKLYSVVLKINISNSHTILYKCPLHMQLHHRCLIALTSKIVPFFPFATTLRFNSHDCEIEGNVLKKIAVKTVRYSCI
jgi:predicted transglutaminase-like protease